MSYLENSRIKLRALEPSDIELLYVWENDANLWHVSDTLTPFSRDILQQYIESAHRDVFEQKQLRLVIDVKEGDKLFSVGLIDLFDIDFLHQRAGIGILIYAEENRRNGYASDAIDILKDYSFNLLNLHQLYCQVAKENVVSIQLFEKAGFLSGGVLKQWRKTPKGWEDVQLMQLIKKNF